MVIYKDLILNGENCNNKAEVFELIATNIVQKFNTVTKEEIIKGLNDREEVSSTGFENGIAIPHTKVNNLEEPQIVVVRNTKINWPSVDGTNTELVVSILVPATGASVHLEVLSNLARNFVNQEFTNTLKTGTVEEVFAALNTAFETKKTEEVSKKAAINIVAVTACTTGIAHTFMAAENLEKAALKNGFNIKVETRSQGGVGNELSSEEIKNADYVLICCDVEVPMARFNGKKLLKNKVKIAVDSPETLFNDMLDAPIYTSDSNDSVEDSKPSFYKSLMTGVAHMLPFTIAGGIFIALSFFFGTQANLDAGLVPVIEALTLGQFFSDIGGLLFSMMLPFLAGYIAFSIGNRAAIMPGVLAGIMASNNGSGFLGAILGGFLAGYAARYLFDKMKNLPKSIQGSYQILFMPVLLAIFIGIFMMIFGVPIAFINTTMQNMLTSLQEFSPILLGAVIGAMMASDMGGPINKAAYVTGTLLLAEGNQAFMAAVMAGGMVPPLALALSTLLHKKLYTQEEQEMGKTNWVLGFSFITEGAIPFAAADPKRVIPALMIGSAVAGALTMAFGILLPAPHGGIFVLPLVSEPILYILCILAGSVVGAVFLSIFKGAKK